MSNVVVAKSRSQRIEHFTRVDFHRFKAFRHFRLDLKKFNILVGPNNAGKSTILAAFRILSAGMRRASAKSAVVVNGPSGPTYGYDVDLATISVAEENIFHNYDDSEPAFVRFQISNGNALMLYFPGAGVCRLIPEATGKPFRNPSGFGRQFNCPIGFVPILGPVEHNELLYEREAARQALFNYRAARNFRNIWFHYPEGCEEFRSILQQTWPGMDIEPPERDLTHEKPLLRVYCPEQRIPRELFWSGFGFQVWCQMLTHLIKSRGASLFLIDEPDIYLHSELQRQLVSLLRDLGPDILIATHSTEIIVEAEPDEILLINKIRPAARRLRDPAQLSSVFRAVGSNMNPILTQLAKTRRVLFVEGKDYQILGKFARKLGDDALANRRDFAVVPIEGFNPERIRSLKSGMETTLGSAVIAGAILDRDFRPDRECQEVKLECERFCNFVLIHACKEIENFLLVPAALNRAIERRLEDRAKRSGCHGKPVEDISVFLGAYCEEKKNYVGA